MGKELKSQPTRVLSSTTTLGQRVINICQGEIGHVMAKQADIVVSDRATTCHVVAVRSTAFPRNASNALVSLCHVDKAGYGGCLRDMIVRHRNDHGSFCDVELHIVGGFSDFDGSSLAISEHLLRIFAQISLEEKDINIILRTCMVGCLNDDGFGSPIGRGLAMDVHSGSVFLAAVDDTVAGPALVLRASRLWSSTTDRAKLSTVHTEHCDDFVVEPFNLETFRGLNVLLSLPDTAAVHINQPGRGGRRLCEKHSVYAEIPTRQQCRGCVRP